MATYTGDNTGNIFNGGGDPDVISGKGGNDTLTGGGANDQIAGGTGGDNINGGDGDDTLFSSEFSPPYNLPYYNNPWTAPLLDTGAEVDTLVGGDGSDRFFVGYGDNVDGGAGGSYGDYLFISFLGAPGGVTADFGLATQTIGGATISGIENISWVQGSNFADDIKIGTIGIGYSDFTAVFGMGGNDTLLAGYYTGHMDGGDGNDVVDGRPSQYLQAVVGGAGDDTLYTPSNSFAAAWGDDGNDTIYAHGLIHGGAGNDTIFVQQSYYPGGIFGDAGDDEIHASDNGHSMSGGAGADAIFGGAGEDLLVAGEFAFANLAGNHDIGLEHDSLSAGGGNDTIWAGVGDTVDGGNGNDVLHYSFAGSAQGIAFGVVGPLTGATFAEFSPTVVNVETLASLRGSEFSDNFFIGAMGYMVTVTGGSGDDIIRSDTSSITAFGDDGGDRFVSGIAGDIFYGGGGRDTIDYSLYTSGVTVTLGSTNGQAGAGAGGDSLVDIEDILGSGQADFLTGNAADNRIDGGAGADWMSGGAGDDTYLVDSFDDIVVEAAGNGLDMIVTTSVNHYTLLSNFEYLRYFGTADAVLTGNGLDNFITGGSGADKIDGGSGADVLDGEEGSDKLTGGEGDDSLSGGTGNDELFGGKGNDHLDGGSGGDLMVGGEGDDQFTIDDAGDTILELVGGGGTDWVISELASYTLGDNLEWLSGSANTSGPKTLRGNSLNNTINGSPGDDTIEGGDGHDYLVGQAGQNILTGGNGRDVFANQPNWFDGDTVTDLSFGEWIQFANSNIATFTYNLSGTTLSYSGGELTLLNLPKGHLYAFENGFSVGLMLVRDVRDDVNGDGLADILWRNDNGSITNWLSVANGDYSNFNQNNSATIAISPDWKVADRGDFNGDGRGDVLLRNDSGAVTTRLGQANGSFASNLAADAARSTDWKIAGTSDFNGDGRSDILWRHDNGQLTTWLGRSDGGFAPNDAADASQPTALKVVGTGDFNGDGRDDVLWRDNSGQLTNWLGRADGGFTPNAAVNPTITNGWRVAGTGDFNGDGRDDILLRNDTGAVTNWLGRTDGGFTVNDAANASLATEWKIAGTGDYNGDGRNDILWRHNNGLITDWLGRVDGGFAVNTAQFSSLSNDWKIVPTGGSASPDFEGNDVIVGGVGNDTIYGWGGNDALSGLGGVDWLEGGDGGDSLDGGPGSDTLAGNAGVDTLTGGLGLDTFIGTRAELNGDTITDFAVGELIAISDANYPNFHFSLSGSTLTYTGGALTLQNLPAGYHLVATPYGAGSVELSLVADVVSRPNPANDFNGDGRSDLLWRHASGAVTDWLGNSSGGFVNNSASFFAGVATSWHVAGTGDFNGDGRHDLIWRNDSGAFTSWLGQVNGGFTANDANAFTTVATTWQVAGTGDFNGDGRDDIVWRNDSGAFTSWLGQVNGGFTANDANAFTTVATTWQVAGTGDFNGDGRDDLIWRNDSGAFTSWLGQVSGGFVPNDANAFTEVATKWQIAGTGDFNGDGRDDILWRSESGGFTEWLGQAAGGFIGNDVSASAYVPVSWIVAATGDYNGDGRDDVLWRNDSGHLTDWLSQPNGGFFANDAYAWNFVATDWTV